MSRLGFVRVAAMAPPLTLADPRANASATIDAMHHAANVNVDVLIGPEMGITGYTCNDLFFQQKLQRGAIEALQAMTIATARMYPGVVIVGLPLSVDDQIFNCAAVLSNGEILGIVPKTYLPTYKEFYDARFFAPAATAISKTVRINGQEIPFGTDLLFRARNVEGLTIGVEICEDLWCPVPPSSLQAMHGATLLVNLSASNETISKAAYRRELVVQQSARCVAGYIYAAAGRGESTTDIVFGSHCLIAENGTLLQESQRFQSGLTFVMADLDVDRLRMNRQLLTTFNDGLLDQGLKRQYRDVSFQLPERRPPEHLHRHVDAHPFVPKDAKELNSRCEEIFHIQTTGLGRRLELIKAKAVSIGVSGGLDSTLALLVLCKTLDRIQIPRNTIKALTMPGFGTTDRTLKNAKNLMSHLGVSYREIDIRPLCIAEMNALGHAPFGINLDGHDHESIMGPLTALPNDKRHDLTFENVQARVRTSLLMNTAFVIGTGDLSELALGWCTYNADHMSMYNPNVSIPKTLVKFLVRWMAEHEFDGPVRETLLDIVKTEISPELLPTDKAGKAQSTEATVGPYELHDFFLYYFLRYGTTPEKILYLASQATFDVPYSQAEIKKWLRMFITRFFNSQFKRSCLPDGPKVGSVSLSPRGDWRMPSDAQVHLWLEELN